jgi:hypothetical protein
MKVESKLIVIAATAGDVSAAASLSCSPIRSVWLRGCAGNCNNNWRNFFNDPSPSLANSYILSSKQFPPPFPFTFFTASVARRRHADDCPAPDSACGYGPSPPTGRSVVLFYDRAAGTGEFYAVNGRADIDIQLNHGDWRNSWAKIVPGNFGGNASTDLLFYDPAATTGEFYTTDGQGGIALLKQHTDWRNSWSQIVPGNFGGNASTDLLFYDAAANTGEFYTTDGQGGIALLKQHTDWRNSWTHIIPGNFGGSGHTDLLFYDATAGTGEFYSTDGQGGITPLAQYTDWRGSWTAILQL